VLVDRLSNGKPANTVNTGPYCKARQRLPLKELNEAVVTTGSSLHQQIPDAWRWKGFNVVLTDGATVQMPDTPDNQADFPQPDSQKPGLGFPMARMVALISLAAGTVIAYGIGAYQGKGTGETSLLSQLLSYLSVGDLLMADRYYCTFAIIALLQIREIPVLFQIHTRKKTDFKLGIKDHGSWGELCDATHNSQKCQSTSFDIVSPFMYSYVLLQEHLINAPKRAKEVAKSCPETLAGVGVHLTDTVPVIIPCPFTFAGCMANCYMQAA